MTWKARFYPSCMEGHLPPFGSARARAHARVERHWRDDMRSHGTGTRYKCPHCGHFHRCKNRKLNRGLRFSLW